MKKLISVVLTLAMVLSMFTTVFADMNSSTGYIDNPLALELGLDISARKDGETAYTADGLVVTLAGDVGAKQEIDYLATLNMGGIRSLFSKPFITNVMGNNQALLNEFNNGTVSTTINVAITYPDGAKINGGTDSLKSASVGVLTAGSTFAEVGTRTITGNTLNITYENASGLKVSDLDDSIDGQLKDITFELADKIYYDAQGQHIVEISLTGSTTVAFSSKTQIINYTGSARHIANVSKDIVHHVLKVVPVVPATCGSTGMTEGIICETHNGYNCGALGTVEPQVTPELPHPSMADGVAAGTIVHIDEVPASCINTGMYEHYTCVLCKQDFDTAGAEKTHAQLTISMIPHNTNGILQGRDATCTEEGQTAGVYCTACGRVSTRQNVTPALGHNSQVNPAQAATCTEDGYTAETVCSRCTVVLIPKTVLAKTGHNFGNWVETTPATYDSEGEMTRTCQNDGCSVSETKTIPKLVQSHVCSAKAELAVITTAPTCTQTGLKQNYCECGLPYGAPESVPAIGHSLTKVNGVAATCTKTGIVDHYACANCGKNYRDASGKKVLASVVTSINNKAHNSADIIDVPGVDPTCVKPGLTTGKKCKLCNTFIKGYEQRAIGALGHKMETVGYSATCTTNGVKEHKHCVVCNKDFGPNNEERLTSFFDIPATGHSYGNTIVITAPQEGVNGAGKKVCSKCQDVKYVEIAALAHVHNEIAEEIITPESCTTDGLKRKIYACCGEVIENNIVIPKHNHTLVSKAKEPSDCYKKGKEAYYECSECHQLFDKDNRYNKITAPKEIDVTSHKFVDHTTYKECIHCGEKVKYQYKNDPNAHVGNHGGIKNNDDEKRTNTDRITNVESNIIIDKKDEISPKMDEAIPEGAKEAGKIVMDITIEKVTEYSDTDVKDREIISETEDLVEIVINIPSELQNKHQYSVLRVHDGVTQELREDSTAEEYIVVDKTAWKITLHVKKFSEYAVIAFDEDTSIDTPEDDTPGSSGGGGALTYKVQFKANGGTVVDFVKVKYGEVIAAPVTTKDGYIFKGWYTDMALTELFDFSTPIKKNITLYAAWEEDTSGGSGWFVDVPETEWFYEAIKYAYNNGLMKGISNTHFAPNQSITRAMFVTVLYRIEKEPQAGAVKFNDVELNSWYDEAVAWATDNGITKGVSETEFAPEQIIIREQIAAMLYRYAQFKGYDVSAGENTNILSYTDAQKITEYAIPAIQWAVGDGVMKGKSESTLNPLEDATRAEAAALLMRVIEKYSK